MQRYELAVIRRAVTRVIRKVGPRRVRVTADRGFADVVLFTLLTALGVACVIRVKKSTKICIAGVWRSSTRCILRAIRAVALWDICSIAPGIPTRCG